jgi:UDP-glucuronate 4-epimerase
MGVIVTGAAGFVGMHVAETLLDRGEAVVGVDNLNNYYDVRLKEARLARLEGRPGFTFLRADVADREAMDALAARHPDTRHVIHLAAQAGVRHSMVDPYAYVTSNVMGHTCVLEAARRMPRLEHLVYASSSSVYGGNRKLPFSETDAVDTPVSLYAATKRADELISHAYGHLYGLPQTGLRFFTVYGPWGRPDMAYYGFAEAMMAGRPITLYEGGALRRDFTYITDIVQGVLAVLDQPPGAAGAPRLFNIGNNRSERVSRLVELLEQALGRKAVVRSAPRPIADVEETWADVDSIGRLGFRPATSLEEGVSRFAAWYLGYCGT